MTGPTPSSEARISAVTRARWRSELATASTEPSGPAGRLGLLPSEVAQGRVGLALPAPERVPLRFAVAHQQDPGHPSR